MTLDIRPTADPNRFDLYEGDQVIGEITNEVDEEDGPDASPFWCAEVWSQMGTGKKWVADSASSLEEIKEWAGELYDEMAAERRELGRGARPPTISTPMGGQKRRR